MRALCVARHRFLSEHYAVWFGALGVQCTAAVGLDGAVVAAARFVPDLVICEYELLATGRLASWERDEILADVPVLAVSLTRRPNEMHLLDVNGIAGFLYLPALTPDDARRLLAAVRRPVAPPLDYSLPAALEWTRPSTIAR